MPAARHPDATRRTPARRETSVAPRPVSGRGATYLVSILGVSRPVSVSGAKDVRIGQVTARQRGCIDRGQLRTIGIANAAIARRVARGSLIRRHRGVYVVADAGPVPLQDETAALLACGEGAVLSHLTAARLLKIHRQRHAAGPIHVTIPGRHGPQLDGVFVHRTATLPDYDIRERHGLPITSPARTALDIAELLDLDDLDWSVDEAIQLRLVTGGSLQRVAAAASGHRGAGKLARAASRHRDSGITRSESEKRFRALIRESGLPEPRFNVHMHGYLYDAYWPELGLVVELDSGQWHSIQPKVEHDTAKGAAAVAAGLVLIRFTAAQLKQAPVRVAARLAQAIARAEARAA